MPENAFIDYVVFVEHVARLFQKLTQTNPLNDMNKETLISLFLQAVDKTNPNSLSGVTSGKLFHEQTHIFGKIDNVSLFVYKIKNKTK
jgi:hypothetical protein